MVVGKKKNILLGLLFLALMVGGINFEELRLQRGQPAQAQAPPDANFKRCLNDKELETERLVRHGVFLREGAWRCNGAVPGSFDIWRDIDENLGPQMRRVTDARKLLFDREFGESSFQVTNYLDGRLVVYYRNFPLTGVYCNTINRLLKDVQARGWGAYAKQAETLRDNVKLDYRACM